MELIAALLLAAPLGYLGDSRKRALILSFGLGLNQLGSTLRRRRTAKRAATVGTG